MIRRQVESQAQSQALRARAAEKLLASEAANRQDEFAARNSEIRARKEKCAAREAAARDVFMGEQEPHNWQAWADVFTECRSIR
jgi:hypothetical protein